MNDSVQFNELDLKELDKNLSDEERKEWNAIYASYRSGALLNGRVSGYDCVDIPRKNKNGETEMFPIYSLVVIPYRVKILIPETEVWYDEASARPNFVMRGMQGAYVDFVITHIDREGACCAASRKRALAIRRHGFTRRLPEPGALVETHILSVGPSHFLAETGGYDTTLSQRDISYSMVEDLREVIRPGEIKKAVFKGFDAEKNRISISIKETEPNPFDGAEKRHPVGCRRISVISGKFGGGIFCRLEKNLDCLCSYSVEQYDEDFDVGDEVQIIVTKFDEERRLVYGRIRAKW